MAESLVPAHQATLSLTCGVLAGIEGTCSPLGQLARRAIGRPSRRGAALQDRHLSWAHRAVRSFPGVAGVSVIEGMPHRYRLYERRDGLDVARSAKVLHRFLVSVRSVLRPVITSSQVVFVCLRDRRKSSRSYCSAQTWLWCRVSMSCTATRTRPAVVRTPPREGGSRQVLPRFRRPVRASAPGYMSQAQNLSQWDWLTRVLTFTLVPAAFDDEVRSQQRGGARHASIRRADSVRRTRLNTK
jgi:hypothetical protein